jgi:Fe-S-cluster containining protein
MNRSERRRQERKAGKKPEAKRNVAPAPSVAIAAVKAQLRQAASPEEIQQIIATLVAQGLPPQAGEELAVYAAEYHDATAILRGEKSAAVTAAVVANAHTWADSMIDQSPERDHRACRAGCAFCCYLPVVLVTAAEAVYLADWLHTHCSAEELAAIQQRLTERLQQQTTATSASPVQVRPPCALLQDNHCLAYPARPLKCRGWNSVRLEACEQAYGRSQSPQPVPVDAYAFVMGNAVLNGLSESATQAGLDGTTYDLTYALARALEIPDAVQRWRKGERLFDTPK